MEHLSIFEATLRQGSTVTFCDLFAQLLVSEELYLIGWYTQSPTQLLSHKTQHQVSHQSKILSLSTSLADCLSYQIVSQAKLSLY